MSKSLKIEYVENFRGFECKQFEDFYCYATSKTTSISIKPNQFRPV